LACSNVSSAHGLFRGCGSSAAEALLKSSVSGRFFVPNSSVPILSSGSAISSLIPAFVSGVSPVVDKLLANVVKAPNPQPSWADFWLLLHPPRNPQAAIRQTPGISSLLIGLPASSSAFKILVVRPGDNRTGHRLYADERIPSPGLRISSGNSNRAPPAPGFRAWRAILPASPRRVGQRV